MQPSIPARQSTKAQIRGVETVMAVVFVVIILVIIGSIVFKGSLTEKQQELKDKERRYLADSVENFIRLPELKCSYFGKFCIDAWKAKAVKELAKEDDAYWNSLRRRMGTASILKLVPLNSTSEAFVFINTTLPEADYSTTYEFRLPVAIQNDTADPKLGFGYIEVKSYLQ
jgi:hypothetical protein